MEFNKQTVKALLGVVCGGIAFAAALLHLDVVAGAAGWLLGILSPLLLGCAIAFILNVPVRAMERCLFPHAKKANKLRRPHPPSQRAVPGGAENSGSGQGL